MFQGIRGPRGTQRQENSWKAVIFTTLREGCLHQGSDLGWTERSSGDILRGNTAYCVAWEAFGPRADEIAPSVNVD